MVRMLWKMAFAGVSVFLLTACSLHQFQYQRDASLAPLFDIKPDYPAVRFAVISDPHLYDTGLGTSGPAFRRVLSRDRKLLAESGEILETALTAVIREKPDFLMICGDLTKDGERLNHLKMQMLLGRMTASGVPVYVVPGNHDVANYGAVRFDGQKRLPVETVSGEMFAEIYREFGYAGALHRDPDSLSYVAEPVPGIWLLALDSCRWKENRPGRKSFADGAFSEATLRWVEKMLIASKQQRKAVIGCMHHGILEHYAGNRKYFPWYVVKEHETAAELLARYGVTLVFTGHFHAQDITVRRFDDLDASLFDVETGSLLTYPSPFRMVRITEAGRAVITSRYVRSIPSRPDGFPEYSKNFVLKNTGHIIDWQLKKYWVAEEDRQLLAPHVAEAYLAHLQGNEEMPESIVSTEGMGFWGRVVVWLRRDLIRAWYTDLPPSDLFVEIDLQTGQAHNRESRGE